MRTAVNVLVDPKYLSIKAAIACALAVLLSGLLPNADAISAGFVALVCISPTAWAGVFRGVDQLVGSAVGGLLATLVLQLTHVSVPSGVMPLVLGVTVACTVYACFRLRIDRGYPVAGFTVLYLFFSRLGSPWTGLSVRMTAVMFGVVSATLVNLLVSVMAARTIVQRRVLLATRELVEPFRALAKCARGEMSSVDAAESWTRAFRTVAALEDEMRHLSREDAWLGWGRSVKLSDAVTRAMDAMEQCAHRGKHIVLDWNAAQTSVLLSDALLSVADGMQRMELLGKGAIALRNVAHERDALDVKRLADAVEALAETLGNVAQATH